MRGQVLRNASFAVAQVVVTGIALFLAYRYLLETVGVEAVGVWSLVLATTSASRVGELGVSGSVVKFVAGHLAQDEAQAAADVVETGAVSVAVALGLVLALGYPVLATVVGWLVQGTALVSALAVLPYAAVSFWLSTVAATFLAGLDGCNRADERSAVTLLATFAYLGLVVALVPGWGLEGLAAAQLGQAMLLLVLSLARLRCHLLSLPVLPWRWRHDAFRRIVAYGASVQLIAVATLTYELVTKGLLTRLGGLESTGYYEMASRMVMQLRALLVAANQVLVPVFARLPAGDPDRIVALYRQSFSLALYLALPFYAAILAAVPLVAEVWVGRPEPEFVVFAALLTLGFLLNNLSAPAYFASLGQGTLRWNLVGHWVAVALTASLGLVLGEAYGGFGVVVGSTIALVAASWLIAHGFHAWGRVRCRDLVGQGDAWLAVASGVGVLVSWGLYYSVSCGHRGAGLALAGVLAFIAVVAAPAWLHALRGTVLGWILGKVGKGA